MESFPRLPRDESGELASWAWPGGYPIYYLDRENSILCSKCANASDSDPDEVPQFKPVAAGINYEDQDCYCAHCSERIESAYVEDKAND